MLLCFCEDVRIWTFKANFFLWADRKTAIYSSYFIFFCDSKKKNVKQSWFYWLGVIWKLLRVLAWPAVGFSRKHGLLWLQCARKERNGWPLWGQLCLLHPGGKDLQLKYQLLWYCKACRASATSTEAMEVHVYTYTAHSFASAVICYCMSWCTHLTYWRGSFLHVMMQLFCLFYTIKMACMGVNVLKPVTHTYIIGYINILNI